MLDDIDQHLPRLLDVTIVYPDGVPTFWEFLQGKCPRVEMDVTPHEIPAEILETEETARRQALGQWIGSIWAAKDNHIEQKINGMG